MTTETEWGVEFDRPGQALTVVHAHNEAAAAEEASAYLAIGVQAAVVRREVSYSPWEHAK